MKKNFFCILTVMEDFGTDPHPHPDPDPFVRGTYPRIRIGIRIHNKISRIRNTAVCEVCDIVAVSFYTVYSKLQNYDICL